MRNGNRHSQDNTAGFDPVALTLAVWLGLIVSVTGMTRLSDAAQAQAQAEAARAGAGAKRVLADAAPALRAGMVW